MSPSRKRESDRLMWGIGPAWSRGINSTVSAQVEV